MKLADLQQHPAYAALSAEEKAQIDDRLRTWQLDAAAVAAETGDIAGLEQSDLRFWLASTARRPWVGLTPGDAPVADAMFEGLLAILPDLDAHPEREALIAAARETSRAVAAADAARAADGFVRDEQLGALSLQFDTLSAMHPDWTPGALRSALDDADLRPLRKALKRHQRETTGLQGFLASLGRRAATGVFNLTHGGLYLATGAADHEGHYRDGVWRNWTGNYEARPASWHQPRTEEELCRLIAEATQLRVVGGGHTFNDSPLTAGTLINLDAYDEVLALDPKAQTLRVQAGMRLRDLGKLLEAHGLGLPVLGSTDAQSLGGLVATDLHGTGRDFGFLSQQIKSLRVIDAAGVARTVGPNDPLFHAVPGALGTCGVVSEIELQLVPAFRLEKRTLMVDRAATEATLDALLEQNEHVSFYYVGGAARTEAIRMHAWNRTDAPVTEHWERKKTLDELKDFAMSAWLPGLAELVVDLDEDNPISNLLAPDDRLVMPGSRAFGRHLFYRHDEIEYGVPYGAHRPCLDAILKLLRDADYFSVVEVRFSPDTSQGLIGPGAGRRTAYVELATPLSQPTDALFAQVEAILLAHGGQPHLGKKTNVTAAQMLQIHGDRFAAFQAVRQAQDPKGKFLNTFTRRVLGT